MATWLYLSRGRAPARRGTFVSAKVPKTMAPMPRLSYGQVPCVPRSFRRGKNSPSVGGLRQLSAYSRKALRYSAGQKERVDQERELLQSTKPLMTDSFATFALPSIAVRRGDKRGVFEPPKAASSRAPRRARSAGVSRDQQRVQWTLCPTNGFAREGAPWVSSEAGTAKRRDPERSGGQCIGAGLLGTFGPSKVPRPRGGPRI